MPRQGMQRFGGCQIPQMDVPILISSCQQISIRAQCQTVKLFALTRESLDLLAGLSVPLVDELVVSGAEANSVPSGLKNNPTTMFS